MTTTQYHTNCKACIHLNSHIQFTSTRFLYAAARGDLVLAFAGDDLGKEGLFVGLAALFGEADFLGDFDLAAELGEAVFCGDLDLAADFGEADF